MNKDEAIEWLYSFKKYGSKLGLERISYLVEQLGNPQDSLKIIHVTGTNGKGSVCKFISSILQEAGYGVGVYLSPHLQRFSERFVVGGQEISEDAIVSLVGQVQPVVEGMIKQQKTPTFFEIVTAMAFVYFKEQKVDYAVVEVGLGGRFDATNVVTPLLAVITNISLEHSEQLGNTLRSIAVEKAGIIKESIPVITATRGEARVVIEQVARKKNAPVTAIEPSSWKRVVHTRHDQEFLIHGFLKDHIVKTSVLGEYQGENIALALGVVEELQMQGIYISDENIVNGIEKTINPGRMEIISEQPLIVLDGAHNPAGMQMLKKTLQEDFGYDRLILVLGILRDKDIQEMISSIVSICDVIIVTKSENIRACEPEKLKEIVEDLRFSKSLFVEDSLTQAVDLAKRIASDTDLICISGSLFTVGEARSYVLKRSEHKLLRS